MIQQEIRVRGPVHPGSLPCAPMNTNHDESPGPSTGSGNSGRASQPTTTAAETDRTFARQAAREVTFGGLRRVGSWMVGEVLQLFGSGE